MYFVLLPASSTTQADPAHLRKLEKDARGASWMRRGRSYLMPMSVSCSSHLSIAERRLCPSTGFQSTFLRTGTLCSRRFTIVNLLIREPGVVCEAEDRVNGRVGEDLEPSVSQCPGADISVIVTGAIDQSRQTITSGSQRLHAHHGVAIRTACVLWVRRVRNCWARHSHHRRHQGGQHCLSHFSLLSCSHFELLLLIVSLEHCRVIGFGYIVHRHSGLVDTLQECPPALRPPWTRLLVVLYQPSPRNAAAWRLTTTSPSVAYPWSWSAMYPGLAGPCVSTTR